MINEDEVAQLGRNGTPGDDARAAEAVDPMSARVDLA